jgi:hypothetical protein
MSASLSHLRKRFLIILSIGIVVSAVSIGFFVARADIREAKPETAESANPDPTPDPNLAPHTLVGSYYTIDENIDAKLLLNNKGITQLEVQPTLYSADGQELVLPSVYVDAQSFRFINLQDWAAIGGDSFRSGNIKLFHLGKDLVLGAQIYLTHDGKSLTFEEKLVEVGKFNSTRQEAVWSMPSNTAEVRVVLTNTTATALDVTGTIAKKPHHVSDPRTITIPPHSTRAFDLRDEFPGSNSYLNSDVVAMSLEHCGSNEALLSRLLVYEQNKGFSNTVQFANPAGGKSNRYEGVGFQIEDIGNQKMNSVIVARNVGTESATVTANVPYSRANGTRSNIALPQLNLSPGEIRAFNTKKIMQRVDDENIKVASLEISYTTAPGSVIVGTHSQSNNRDHVFRIPMWDPLGQRSPTGGYPWRIEGTSVTETYIKNISDLEEDYSVTLFWENGGMYTMGRKSIAPHETVNIDVMKLRQEQTPDSLGRTIPLSVSSGQLKWSLRRKDSLPIDDQWANLAVIGRSEQVDLTKQLVNSYACQNTCADTVDPDSGRVVPATLLSLEVGSTQNFEAWQDIVDTYGNYVDDEQVGDAVWSSSNSSAVEINQTGYAVAVSAAENVGIQASWVAATHYTTEPCESRPWLADDNKTTDCQNASVSKSRIIAPEDGGGGSCGACGHGTENLVGYGDVTVLPLILVEINVPSQAADGSSVFFISTVSGATPTGYQWSFTTPSGAGNNPNLSFGSATSLSTFATAKWFANPNSACTASADSVYTVKLTVSFSGRNPITKQKSFTVQLPWPVGGETTGQAGYSGGPGVIQNASGWHVVDAGTLGISTSSTVEMFVPTNSQFYSKVFNHEQVHVGQWASNGLMGSLFTVSGLYAALQNVTDTDHGMFVTKLGIAAQNYVNSRGVVANGLCDQAETAAYVISDALAPQYYYHACGRPPFANCHP